MPDTGLLYISKNTRIEWSIHEVRAPGLGLSKHKCPLKAANMLVNYGYNKVDSNVPPVMVRCRSESRIAFVLNSDSQAPFRC